MSGCPEHELPNHELKSMLSAPYDHCACLSQKASLAKNPAAAKEQFSYVCVHTYFVQIVTATTSAATASPCKLVGSFLHRAVVSSHSPVKASPQRTGAQRPTSSPLTRSGRSRQPRTANNELFDMCTQVIQEMSHVYLSHIIQEMIHVYLSQLVQQMSRHFVISASVEFSSKCPSLH